MENYLYDESELLSPTGWEKLMWIFLEVILQKLKMEHSFYISAT